MKVASFIGLLGAAIETGISVVRLESRAGIWILSWDCNRSAFGNT